MLSEEFEFLLSQYLDGTLTPEERATVDAELERNPDARACLEQYRRLDGLVRSADPLPAIHWDRLAEHLSNAVADEADSRRIVFIGWRRATVWAAAALVFLTLGVFTWQLTHQTQPGTLAVVPPSVQPGIIDIKGPVAEAPVGPPVMNISVSRPPGLDPSLYADDGNLVVRRPMVSLAAAAPDADGSIR